MYMGIPWRVLVVLACLSGIMQAQGRFKGGPPVKGGYTEGALLVMRDGTPEVRFGAAHVRAFHTCYGYLFFSRDRIRYEVVRPEDGRGDAFDFPRAELTYARQYSVTNEAELNFGGKVFRFWHMPQGFAAEGTLSASRKEALSYHNLVEAANNFGDVLAMVQLKQEGEKARLAAQSVTPEPPKAGPAFSTLRVVSQPGSVQVYVDDRFKGVTSEGEGVLVVENLAPGSHRIRLGLPGYKEWRQEVTLTAGDTLEVAAKLVSAGPAPLTLDEVDEALTNGVPKKRVIALVTQFGVDFALTEDVEQRLRKSGADSDILLLITRSKK